jgi:hypothetical protein
MYMHTYCPLADAVGTLHAFVYVCMCINIYMHIYIYIYMHTFWLPADAAGVLHVCVYACIYIHTYINTYIHTYSHTPTWTCAGLLCRKIGAVQNARKRKAQDAARTGQFFPSYTLATTTAHPHSCKCRTRSLAHFFRAESRHIISDPFF